MPDESKTLIDLEKKFWQSMVDNDSDTATSLLNEPAVMVSAHGAFQFDHAGYRKMADQGTMVVTSFDLSDLKAIFPNDQTAVLTYTVRQGVAPRGNDGKPSAKATVQDMHDTSTWVKAGDGWKCVMHTEAPAQGKP